MGQRLAEPQRRASPRAPTDRPGQAEVGQRRAGRASARVCVCARGPLPRARGAGSNLLWALPGGLEGAARAERRGGRCPGPGAAGGQQPGQVSGSLDAFPRPGPLQGSGAPRGLLLLLFGVLFLPWDFSH